MEKYTNALSKVVMSVATDAVNNFSVFMRDAEGCPLNDEQKEWMEAMAKQYLESFGKKPVATTKGKKKAPVEAVAMVEDSPSPPPAVEQPAAVMEKSKRAPSRYNLFVREHIPLVKADNPQLPHKEVMKIVVGLWKENNNDEKPEASSSRTQVVVVKEPAAETQAPEPESTPEETEKEKVVEKKQGNNKKKEPEAVVAVEVGGEASNVKKTVKRNPTEYNAFVKEITPTLKKEFPNLKKTELMDMVNERWNEQHQ
jgi:hypothetical protein